MLEPYQRLMAGELTSGETSAALLPDPIGVGAVGGSGTRLLAQILSSSGVAMAAPLNKAGDAIDWPPYQKLLGPDMLARHSRQLILHNAYQIFEQLLVQRRQQLGLSGRAGWKVPGTFHWLEELAGYFPEFQYLHLVRHGLDMAYSGNQNQVKNWAGRLGLDLDYTDAGKVQPHSMLEYWLSANERALATANRCMPGRFLVVKFEELCLQPAQVLHGIMEFLGLDAGEQQLAELAALVRQPDSVGRYRQFDWRSQFTQEQLARLERLGYTP